MKKIFATLLRAILLFSATACGKGSGQGGQNGVGDVQLVIGVYDGARRGYETVKAIYADNGKADNYRMIETPEPHWWCKDIVRKAIKKEAESLGWF